MIIIETPAPPTRERLVLVPITIRDAVARDATPEDLERAGWVLRGGRQELDCAISDLTAQVRDAVARAEKAERELAEVRELQRLDERDGNVGFSLTCWVESILEQLNVARINRTELGKAADQYRRERDTLRAELARLTAPVEGEPTDEELERVEDRSIGKDVAGFAEYASGRRALYRLGAAHERATHARSTDAVYRERDILAALAAKLARRLGYPAWTAEHDLASDPTWEPEWKDIVFFRLPTGQCSWHLKAGEKAECGLDSLPVAVEAWDGHTTDEKYSRVLAFLSSPDERARQQPAQDRATERERDTLRAELARLTAPALDPSTPIEAVDAELRAAGVDPDALAARGLAFVRECQERATDEELCDLYRKIYETHGGGTISVSHEDCRRAAVAAVAARVRQERCLIARAVGMGVDCSVVKESDFDAGVAHERARLAAAGVTVATAEDAALFEVVEQPAQDRATDVELVECERAEVPATLARLLGEVAK